MIGIAGDSVASLTPDSPNVSCINYDHLSSSCSISYLSKPQAATPYKITLLVLCKHIISVIRFRQVNGIHAVERTKWFRIEKSRSTSLLNTPLSGKSFHNRHSSTQRIKYSSIIQIIVPDISSYTSTCGYGHYYTFAHNTHKYKQLRIKQQKHIES